MPKFGNQFYGTEFCSIKASYINPLFDKYSDLSLVQTQAITFAPPSKHYLILMISRITVVE